VRALLPFSEGPTTVSGAPLLLVGQTPTNRFPCGNCVVNRGHDLGRPWAAFTSNSLA